MESKSVEIQRFGYGVVAKPNWFQIGGLVLALVLAGYFIYRLCGRKLI